MDFKRRVSDWLQKKLGGGGAEQIDEANQASNTEVSMNLVLGRQDPSPGA